MCTDKQSGTGAKMRLLQARIKSVDVIGLMSRQVARRAQSHTASRRSAARLLSGALQPEAGAGQWALKSLTVTCSSV